MKIVGLTGRARAGKDTAGKIIENYVTENRDYRCKRDSFARKLKVSAARALGFNGTDAECVEFCETLKHTGKITPSMGDGSTPFSITGREYLQLYGTEAHRDVFGSNFWVDALFKDYEPEVYNLALIITDARFPNEAEAIRARGGEIWEIDRPGEAISDGLEAHSSEVGLPSDLIDLIIANVGDLKALQSMVESACETRLA